MGFIAAGLLKGLGAGLTAEYEKRREDALIALRRQYQLEDSAAAEERAIAAEGRAETRDIASDERKAKVQTGLLELAQRYKKEENETNFEYEQRLIRLRAEEDRKGTAQKAGIDRDLETHRSRLRRSENKEDRELAAEIEGGQVQSIDEAEDGSMVVTYKNGNVVRKAIKLRDKTSRAADDEGDGTIAGARERREGKPEAAAKPPKAPDQAAENKRQREAALARLGSVYHRATPQEFPGLFRNGKKISMEEAKQRIRERYP